MENPFTDEYAIKEVKNYGLEPNFVFNKNDVSVNTDRDSSPLLIIDGTFWMSMSKLVLKGQFLPILQAKGKVVTAGLGLGYFVLKVIDKEDVQSVDVYENNRDVIDFFESTFKGRDNYSKVNIIKGNANIKLKNKKYDFAFIDIYQEQFDDKMIDGIKFFSSNNEIGDIFVCSHIETIFYACDYYKIIPENKLTDNEMALLKMRRDLSPVEPRDKTRKEQYPSEDYCEEFLEAINRL